MSVIDFNDPSVGFGLQFSHEEMAENDSLEDVSEDVSKPKKNKNTAQMLSRSIPSVKKS